MTWDIKSDALLQEVEHWKSAYHNSTDRERGLEKDIEKLQAFKDYVHKRLDDAGIEKDPESEHKAKGCRIGGRLDIVLNNFKDISDFKSSLKREIEKRIEELEERLKNENSLLEAAYTHHRVFECRKFLELINAVEP